jgi:hypothetical protein
VNYFNYFTEVEDTFVRRRGKHLFLSPMDWALIESWKEIGIPLHIALRGIEKAFDSWESKPRKRSIKTLLYCQEEVEAQYAEWLESRVGATEEQQDDANEAAPFSRTSLLEHLRNARAGLAATMGESSHADLVEAMGRAVRLLTDLEDEYQAIPVADAQKLEHSLSGIDRLLNEAVLAAASREQLAEITKEIKKQLRPYKSHMEPSVYEQTLDNFLLKRLREQFGVARLSLFYL